MIQTSFPFYASAPLVSSEAVDINDAGQVVGTSGRILFSRLYPSGHYMPYEACMWQDGAVIDLGMPTASAINTVGQVVGGKLLWHDGVVTDLNTLIDPSTGWTITKAVDINDSGQIVGQGTFNGQTNWFFMGPAAEPNQVFSFAVTGFLSSMT